MKRKTFVRLRILALSALLVEAAILLILLLAQNGASAAVSDLLRLSRNGTVWLSGSSDKRKTESLGGRGNRDECAHGYLPCGASGDAADLADADGFVDSIHFGAGGGDLSFPAPWLYGAQFAGVSDFFAPPGGDGVDPSGGPGDPSGPDNPGNPGTGKPGSDHPGDPPPGDDYKRPPDSGPLYIPPIDDGPAGGLPGGGLGGTPDIFPGVPTVAVPEAATAPLFVAGLAILLIVRRRKYRVV